MKMTFSDIDEHVEDNETRHGSDSDISWKSDEYSAMISKATTATSGKKHRVIFQVSSQDRIIVCFSRKANLTWMVTYPAGSVA